MPRLPDRYRCPVHAAACSETTRQETPTVLADGVVRPEDVQLFAGGFIPPAPILRAFPGGVKRRPHPEPLL